MSNELIVKVNNRKYGGWKSFNIQRSLDDICGNFTLDASDIYPGKPDNWGIKLGDPCTIELENQLLVTGIIEEIIPSYDKEKHEIVISGRDKTCNLVDCSYWPYNANAYSKPTEWKGQPIIEIIKTLCQPFQVDVVVDTEAKKSVQNSIYSAVNTTLETFNTESETIEKLIRRMCLSRAVFPICNENGELVLTRAGGSKTAAERLKKGVNILSGKLFQSNKDRFSHYIVKGSGIGIDGLDIGSWLNLSGQCVDSNMEREGYRPIIIPSDSSTTKERCETQAYHEMGVRVARSRKLTYTVQGYTQFNGDLWRLNSLVHIEDNFLDIKKPFLISAISYTNDENQGSITTMDLVLPETYSKIATSFDIGFSFDKPKSED